MFDIITFPPGRDDHDDDDDDDYDDGITVSLYLNHIQQQHLVDSAWKSWHKITERSSEVEIL